MSAGLAKLLDKAFVLGFVLPALAFLSALGFAFGCPAQICGGEKAASNQFAELTYAVLLVYTLGVVLLAFNYGIYRFFEGYYLPSAWTMPARRQRRKAAALAEKAEKLEGAAGDALAARVRQFYPSDPNDVLPTGFGNAIRAFERYPVETYGVDAISAWPRLLAVVPKDFLAHVDDAKSLVDLWINLTALGLTFDACVAIRAVATWHGAGHVLEATAQFALGALAAGIAYKAAVASVPAWGEQVKAAFDCYLPNLGKQLGFELPPAGAARNAIWTRFSQQALYGAPFTPPSASDAADTGDDGGDTGDSDDA